MSEAVVSHMTEDEFVAYELTSPDRHEFIDGVTREMTGASIRHNDVALNLAFALRAAAKGTGCKVNIEGVRLKVNNRRHYYPERLRQPRSSCYLALSKMRSSKGASITVSRIG